MATTPTFDPVPRHGNFHEIITGFVVEPPDSTDFSGHLRITAIYAGDHRYTLRMTPGAVEELLAGLKALQTGVNGRQR